MNNSQEENTKYFTPSIEDIRVGYECEFHGMTVGGLVIMDFRDGGKTEHVKDPDIKVWESIKCGTDILNGKKSVNDIIHLIGTDQIRTPYLTQEQIEAEGWVEDKDHPSKSFTKGNNKLGWLKGIIIRDDKEEGVTVSTILIYTPPFGDTFSIRYNGHCKDINTLRYISKLLNIN